VNPAQVQVTEKASLKKSDFFFLGFEPGLEEKEVCAQARRKISEQGVL
jgi:hypothetical protein